MPRGVVGRVVGLDLGARRIGVAVSDSARSLATARTVFERSGTLARDFAQIALIVEECDANLVVVGLPLSLNGEVGPAARATLDEIANLRRSLKVPVEAFDERLSTVEALSRREARKAPSSRGASRSRGPDRKARASIAKKMGAVDDEAAAVILQSFLDRVRQP
jgi:putative Holliday junction resolvase